MLRPSASECVESWMIWLSAKACVDAAIENAATMSSFFKEISEGTLTRQLGTMLRRCQHHQTVRYQFRSGEQRERSWFTRESQVYVAICNTQCRRAMPALRAASLRPIHSLLRSQTQSYAVVIREPVWVRTIAPDVQRLNRKKVGGGPDVIHDCSICSPCQTNVLSRVTLKTSVSESFN